MTLLEILLKCEEQLKIAGPTAEISLVMPGSFGTGQKPLCAGGPVGKIVTEQPPNHVLVFFSAQEVKTYVWSQLSPTT